MAAVHEQLYHPDWRQVANLADVPLFLLEAAIIRLEVFASSNKPIGSVRGFPIEALAAHWDLPLERLQRIFAALKNEGWIDKAESVPRPKILIRELLPVSGRLTMRRNATPAALCQDLSAGILGDPVPARSALAAAKARV